MYSPCYKLFAGPTFAHNKHDGILGRNLFDPVQHIFQRFAMADDIFKVMFQLDFFLQVGAFFFVYFIQPFNFNQ